MKFEEFNEAVLKLLRIYYKDRADIYLENVYKNNSSYCGLYIRMKETECKAMPVFNMEEYYVKCKNGEITLDNCMHTIIDIAEQHIKMNEANKLAESLCKWEKVRDKIYPAIFPVKGNERLLEPLVKRKLLDLVIVYIIRKAGTRTGIATVKITSKLLEYYGIMEEELHRQAMENLEKDNYMFIDLEQMMLQTLIGDGKTGLDYEPVEELYKERLYVLRNNVGLFGAAGILNVNLLQRVIGRKNCYILPSSVHETVFVVEGEDVCAKELNGIIERANRDVSVQEQLSDHCYYYEGERGKIKLCA